MKLQFSKKTWWLIFVIALLGLGLFIYFIFLLPAKSGKGSEVLPEEVKADKAPPSTAVVFPQDKSWHNADFKVTIRDSDLGAGLLDFLPGEKGCRYIIEDLGTGEAVGDFRKCGLAEINVPVGENKVCSSSYLKEDVSQGKCKVSTIAFDKADNNSGWKSSLFNIDLIKPKVEKVPPGTIGVGEKQTFTASISDNSKITGCWFYVNGENTEEKVKIEPIPCQDGEHCTASVSYNFDKEGEYYLNFACSDTAGNLGSAEHQILKVATNHPPKISSCRVSPAQGSTQTEFQFRVTSLDPEGDNLSFFWDFGDGGTSTEQNPTHFYSFIETYTPKVIVSDGKGGSAECQTAWVVVSES